MECPICKTGEVEHEFFDDGSAAELSCTNKDCPSFNYGIYCWLSDYDHPAIAEAFYEEWQVEYIASVSDESN